MKNVLARKRAVTAFGAAVYALLAALGHQAQSHGHVDIPHALLVALALCIPAYALLAFLLKKSRRGSRAGYHILWHRQGVPADSRLLRADVCHRLPRLVRL